MSYGYRLNVEDIFLKNADECWVRAEKNMVLVRDEDGPTTEDISFIGPRSEECISDCVFAVTGWAICLEAYVNLAWNTDDKTKNMKDELRSKNTYDKIKYILKENAIDLSDKNWLTDINQLFTTRNNLLHFKDIIEYVGFCFAAEYQKSLSKKNLKLYRNALEEAIKVLSNTVKLDSKLLNGDFEIFYESG